MSWPSDYFYLLEIQSSGSNHWRFCKARRTVSDMYVQAGQLLNDFAHFPNTKVRLSKCYFLDGSKDSIDFITDERYLTVSDATLANIRHHDILFFQST